MAGRLFNEKEVSEILKRASASRADGNVSDSGGISLEELQQVGVELGFDPSQIELAAREIGTTPPTRGSIFNPRMVLDRTVDGEVSADDWLGMVAVIQRYHKNSGAITQRGANYDWAGSEEGGSLALTVNVRHGRSRIRIESNRWMGILMACVFWPALGFVFSSVLLKHGNPLGAALVVCAFTALWYGLLRFFRQSHVENVSSLLNRLIDEIDSKNVSHPLLTAAQPTSEQMTQSQSIQS